MANDAIASIQATVLPDEIAKTLSATMTVQDANDKWYFKKTSVANSSDLMTGNTYIDYTAKDLTQAPQPFDRR